MIVHTGAGRAFQTGVADPNPFDGIEANKVNLWTFDSYHASAYGYYLEALVVFGGPQVPDRAEAFLREHPFVDVAAHGEGEATFDLTPKVAEARVYRLRFAPTQGGSPSVQAIEVLVDGVPQPELISVEPGRTDVLRLSMPAMYRKVSLRVKIQGAKGGTLLIQKA